MEYPKKFEKCPCCGSTTTFSELETQAEIEKGNLKTGTKIPMIVSQCHIVNPQDNSVLLFRRQFPLLVSFLDTCTECGCIYCREIHKTVGVLDVGVKGKGPGLGPVIGNN